ncbi:MAG: NUDIX domain-containing protein [Bacteroidales bacterium]|nr:NUDIX domain-containing protein [Bacteroidales bacterium]
MVGRAFRWQCHEGNKLLHPTVHLYIKNSKGEMFLQKRPSWKKIEPGKWDVAVGGHVKLLEKTEAALEREAEEELKLKNFKAKFVKSYVYESAVEKELVHIYFLKYDGDLSPTDETDGGRFWSMDEIKTNLKKKVFTPWFEKEFGWIS